MTVTTEASTALSSLADPVRWRIVELLGDEQLCVCHLVDELEISQPLVSHHLKVLRDAGLVVGERYRYWTYYRAVPGALSGLAAMMQEIAEREPASDRRPCC